MIVLPATGASSAPSLLAATRSRKGSRSIRQAFRTQGRFLFRFFPPQDGTPTAGCARGVEPVGPVGEREAKR
jgi:hypothetical protein